MSERERAFKRIPLVFLCFFLKIISHASITVTPAYAMQQELLMPLRVGRARAIRDDEKEKMKDPSSF